MPTRNPATFTDVPWASRRRQPTRICAIVGVTVLLCGLLGCATSGPDDSDLPWSTQESWEGAPSLPGMGTPGSGGSGI